MVRPDRGCVQAKGVDPVLCRPLQDLDLRVGREVRPQRATLRRLRSMRAVAAARRTASTAGGKRGEAPDNARPRSGRLAPEFRQAFSEKSALFS